MRGEWIREPTSDTSVVFVHGILSSGAKCWQHDNGTYWPDLLKDEAQWQHLGIYVYTYQTGIASGSYSLGNIVDDLKEHLVTLDDVTNYRRIIFVCHSMGGIVVRRFLVKYKDSLCKKNIEIGLYMLASPSLGAKYANWLEPIAKLAGHAQAKALRFSQDNQWLNDLDIDFLNLKESRSLTLHGKELIEDKFIIPKLWLFKQVVEPFSGAKYFAEPYKVSGSDHFSIAKPEDKAARQHRLLLAFLKAVSQPVVLEHNKRQGLSTQTKPAVNTEDPRTLLISYASEKPHISQHASGHSTEKWVEQFSRRLQHLNIRTVPTDVNINHQQLPIETRNTASPTDYLVIFTLDYSEKLPSNQLPESIEAQQRVGTLMWVLKLCADEFCVCRIGQHPWWHKLQGSASNGRFKKLSDPDWEDEHTEAATTIHEHPSCDRYSSACPNH